MTKRIIFIGFFSIFAVLIIGILFFSRFSIQNFLINPSKTYSIIRFDTKLPNKINLGDTVSGKGIPKSTVKISFSPSKISADVATNEQGIWFYQIPQILKSGIQRLTVMNFDQKNNVAFVKSYKLEVLSSNFLKSFKLLENKPAKAQENPSPKFPEGKWVSDMISQGIYPVIEDGEIIFYGEDQYKEAYHIDCYKNSCYKQSELPEKIIKEIKSSFYLLADLKTKLEKNGYDHIYVLDPYFPDIEELQKQHRIRPPDLKYKQEIDAQTLGQYITEVVYASRVRKYYWSNPNEMATLLLEKTDPIFGFYSLTKWATLKPNQVTDEERINAVFALTIILTPVEKLGLKAFDLSANTVLNIEKMIKEAGVLRKALREGEEIPMEAIVNKAGDWIIKEKAPSLLALSEAEEGVSYAIKESSSGLNSTIKQVLSGNYKESGFDAAKSLRERKGNFIEVGGPTTQGYELVNINRLDRRLYITNIDPKGCPLFDPFSRTPRVVRYLPIDFPADATNLKFTDKSIGALFASCLNGNIRSKAIAEAARVLEDGGLLIWQGGTEQDIIEAVFREGLVVKESRRSVARNPDGSNLPFFNVIFQKPISGSSQGFAIVRRSSAWTDTRILGYSDSRLYDRLTYIPSSIPLPPGIRTNPKYTEPYYWLRSALKTQRISVIDPENIIQQIVKAHIYAVNNFMKRTGRNIPLNLKNLNELAQNGYAYIIGDEFMGRVYGVFDHSNNFFLVGEGIFRDPYGLHVISHELIHGISPFTSKGWKYMGPNDTDKMMTGIYEIMTDVWSDISRGIDINSSPNVASGFRKFPDSARFIKRINQWNPKLMDDFLEFALTGSGDKLISQIFGYQDASNFMDKIVGAKKWKPDYEAFTRYLKESGGINFQALAYTGTALELRNQWGSDNNTHIIEPAIEFGEDFINDNIVTISKIQGQFIPNAKLDIEAIVSSFDGSATDPSNFSFVWVLDGKTLRKDCESACEIFLPADLQRTDHTLTISLVKKGSDKIEASDYFTIRSSSAPTVTATSLSVNNSSPITPDQFGNNIPITLLGTLGKTEEFTIPFVINFSDGTSKYTGLKFNYVPLAEPPFTPNPSISLCKEPYPQCAKTTGLDDYEKGHTILVTPICDDSGNITDYKKEDLGDKGECN